jgi:hypothetical protein
MNRRTVLAGGPVVSGDWGRSGERRRRRWGVPAAAMCLDRTSVVGFGLPVGKPNSRS